MVLRYSVAKELPVLILIPPVVKEERDRQMRWLGDYSFRDLNSGTLTISTMSAMQYGPALECLVRKVIIADPVLVPVHILKVNVSGGF